MRAGPPGNDSLIGRKLSDQSWAVYGSRSYVERSGRPTTPDDLNGRQLIGFEGPIENITPARWLGKLGSFCRVILFDKRGTGLSDRVAHLPVMDERMDDVRAVMDAVGIESAAQFGISEGGSLAALFAASHPERTQSLVLYGAFARFLHWIATDKEFEALISYIDEHWGSGASLPNFAPSKADDAALQQW
ncbi:MAG: alpha/beta fold hydrolase [Mesorhizobium sp.]|nr:MAG: alpha/beta fold hydrolase [Mesorhizobium sp.]